MAYTKFNEFTLASTIDLTNDYLIGYNTAGSSNKEIRFPVALFNVTDISNKIGDLTTLTTTAKSNLVYAINELNSTKITINSLSTVSPLVYNSGVFSIQQANSTTSGYLSYTDWNTFNNKITGVTLTTIGTSGTATYTSTGNTLNIPQYVGLSDNETISGIKTFSTKIVSDNIGTSTDTDFNIYRNNILSGYVGTSNTNFGYNSKSSITTGGGSVSFGIYSLYSNTSGSYNSAIGANTLKNNTTGGNNTVIGANGLYSNTIGISNTALGYGTLYSNTTGNNNVAIGYMALNDSITGSENIAIGVNAGLYAGSIAAHVSMTANNDSIYIGNSAYSLFDGSNNEIVIGNNIYGNGTNTVTIGNSFTTNNYFTGNLSTTSLTITSLSTPGIVTNNSTGNIVTLGYENDTAKFLCSDGTWDTVVTSNLVMFNTLSSSVTAYTLQLTDLSKTIETTSTSAITITIPANISVAFEVGSEINILRYGSGTVTFVADTNVTINSRSTLVTIGHQYAGVTLIKRDTNEWYLVGDLA
jgi:trimeric autotransporter adhesin